MPKQSDSKIQKADPLARRVALIAVAAGGFVVLGFAAAGAMQPETVAQAHIAVVEVFAVSPNLLPLVGGVLVLPMIVVAMTFWIFARRIEQAGRFPLPGQRVVRDTRVKEGEAAISYARVLRGLALVLIIACISVPVLLVGFVRTLTG